MVSKRTVRRLDLKIISFFRTYHLLIARLALFIVFFWFGFIKLLGTSPASPLAEALTARTVGMAYFDVLFTAVALLECIIGVLFLFPRSVRITLPLLAFHMAIVCAPLLLVPEFTWQSFLVPTLEGQYIIKNVVIIAVAFGIAAHTEPISKQSK